jgi:DNA-binding PadR family transcriptional regulator
VSNEGSAGRSRTEGRRRFFRKGDLRLLILDLLSEQPRHGYDVIRAIEGRFGGVRAPSPGTVYPTLELLADQGLIVGHDQEGKRVFGLTDAGRAHLAEQQQAMHEVQTRMREWWAPATREELRRVHAELQSIHRTLARGGGDVAPEALTAVRDIVSEARRRIDEVLEGQGISPEAEPSPAVRAHFD